MCVCVCVCVCVCEGVSPQIMIELGFSHRAAFLASLFTILGECDCGSILFHTLSVHCLFHSAGTLKPVIFATR